MDYLTHSYSLLERGGPLMWPLLAASVMALAAGIERLLVIKDALVGADQTIEAVSSEIENSRIDNARAMALRASGPVGRVIAAGLDKWHRGAAACEKAMEEQAMIEREGLMRRLIVLDTVITIAPLLGLLGTVTGMIAAFKVVGSKNQLAAPTAITGGVAEALIATATGLAVAIFTLVLYNYLNERVRQVVGMMEIAGTRIVNLRSLIFEEEKPDASRTLSA